MRCSGIDVRSRLAEALSVRAEVLDIVKTTDTVSTVIINYWHPVEVFTNVSSNDLLTACVVCELPCGMGAHTMQEGLFGTDTWVVKPGTTDLLSFLKLGYMEGAIVCERCWRSRVPWYAFEPD